MNKKLFTIFFLLQSLFQIGCKEDASIPMLPQNENGNFVLNVSNQSFAIDPVDIKIYIDDTLAVNQEFPVGDQHIRYKFIFDISNGEHVLLAKSINGEAILEESFTITDSVRWAYVRYWYYPEERGGTGPTPRMFTFAIWDESIGIF